MKIFFLIYLCSLTLVTYPRDLHLFGRFYVKDALLTIFGNSNVNKEIVNKYVVSRILDFGDPCVINERIFIQDNDNKLRTKLLNPDTTCENTMSNSKISFGSNPSTIRYSLLSLACEELTQYPINIKHVLAKASIFKNSSLSSYQQMQNLYQVFYPANNLNLELAKSFLNIGSSNHYQGQEKWKYIILALCMSEYWSVN